jgi:hypothetical protein
MCHHGVCREIFFFPEVIWVSGLEINADRTKYMVMARDQNAGRSRCMKIDNSSMESVEEFTYLGTTLTIKILFRQKLRAD